MQKQPDVRACMGDGNLGLFLLSAYDDRKSSRKLVSRVDVVEHTGLPMLGNFQVIILQGIVALHVRLWPCAVSLEGSHL